MAIQQPKRGWLSHTGTSIIIMDSEGDADEENMFVSSIASSPSPEPALVQPEDNVGEQGDSGDRDGGEASDDELDNPEPWSTGP